MAPPKLPAWFEPNRWITGYWPPGSLPKGPDEQANEMTPLSIECHLGNLVWAFQKKAPAAACSAEHSW